MVNLWKWQNFYQIILATDEDQAKSSKVQYKEVLNIIEWLQCFSLHIAVIARSNASRVVDLLGYQNLIVQSQLKYRDGCWAVYDRQFRQKASAVSIPEWSVTLEPGFCRSRDPFLK